MKKNNKEGQKKNAKNKGTMPLSIFCDVKGGNMASSPYNFIRFRLLDILAHPMMKEKKLSPRQNEEKVALYKGYVKEVGKYSGYIQLMITTKTPCFIGGKTEGTKAEDNLKQYFYEPGGKLAIPGSSLRGMTKNLFKIITVSSFKADEDFTERKLYFRDVAGKNGSALVDLYKNKRMNVKPFTAEGKTYSKSSAESGFLVRYRDAKGVHYGIYPTSNAKRYNSKELQEKKWKPQDEKPVIYYGINQNIPRLSANEVLAVGGAIGGHQAGWCFDASTCVDDRIPVGDDVISSYEKDENNGGLQVIPAGRKKSDDENQDTSKQGSKIYGVEGDQARALMSCVKDHQKIDYVCPCFYMRDSQGRIESFGLGNLYRIPYKTSIAQHVPEHLREPKKVDFAEAVFGDKALWAGRVQFEDALPVSYAEEEFEYAKPLMSPHPTAFQMYLLQDDALKSYRSTKSEGMNSQKQGKQANPEWSKEMKHWDSGYADNLSANTYEPLIRGYKLYWHQKTGNTDWHIGDGESHIKGSPKIRPVGAGAVFEGRIYFESLSDVELGALLAVFHLKELDMEQHGPEADRVKAQYYPNAAAETGEPVYKIGRGKPLGMGSIHIASKLFLSDDKEKYTELWEESGWKSHEQEEPPDKYIEEFKRYLAESIKNKKLYQDMLGELWYMMDWNMTSQPCWKEKTAYMGGTETRDEKKQGKADERFKKRVPLLSPKDFVRAEFHKDKDEWRR